MTSNLLWSPGAAPMLVRPGNRQPSSLRGVERLSATRRSPTCAPTSNERRSWAARLAG